VTRFSSVIAFVLLVQNTGCKKPQRDVSQVSDPQAAERQAMAAELERLRHPPETREATNRTPFRSDCSELALNVELSQGRPRQGNAGPHAGDGLRVVLVNKGQAAVQIMLPNDGSMTGRRNPSFVWQSQGALQSSKLLPPSSFGGNTDPLSEKDVAILNPGEKVTLSVRSPMFRETGTYRVSAKLRSDPQGVLVQGHSTPALPAIVAKARASRACELESNTVEFSYQAPPAKKEKSPGCDCVPNDPLCWCE
jgi:hypothetical protein